MAPRAKKRAKAGYMISAVAELYKLHPQTLRLYERAGLLEPSRSQCNTRLYTAADRAVVLCEQKSAIGNQISPKRLSSSFHSFPKLDSLPSKEHARMLFGAGKSTGLIMALENCTLCRGTGWKLVPRADGAGKVAL